MTATFLDYYKLVLHKVSFDAGLFIKEYNKAAQALSVEEVEHLNNWMKENGLDKIVAQSPQENCMSNKKSSLVKKYSRKSGTYLYRRP